MTMFLNLVYSSFSGEFMLYSEYIDLCQSGKRLFSHSRMDIFTINSSPVRKTGNYDSQHRQFFITSSQGWVYMYSIVRSTDLRRATFMLFALHNAFAPQL